MTTLAIMATYEKKRLKCYGTVAAGEHVAVTVTDGAQWMGEGRALRLRVLFGPNTVAVFPFAEGDAWTTAGTQDADATCELNLNTVQAEKYLKHGGTCLWILDDIENHTLYATGEFDVLPWPKRRGIDEPIDLDGYPLLLDEINGLREDFEAYQQTVSQMLATKQDTIFDLATIRSGATSGATAVQPSQIARFVDGAEYRQSYGEQNNPAILFMHGTNVIVALDATPFVKDGMVSNVEVKDGNLVIMFNTDSGKQPISIPLTDIFNPDNYYNKGDVNALLAGKQNVLTFDNAPTIWSNNPVKSGGIWSMLWGTLGDIPEGLSSVYAWVLNRLGLKRNLTDMACTAAVAGIPQIGSGNFVVTSPSGTSTTLTPFDSSGVIGWGWYMTYPYIYARASNSYDIIFGTGISDMIPLDMTAETQTVTYNGETWTVAAFTGEIVNTRLANMTDIPAASTSTPQMDGTGSAGSSAEYARGDHVHPSDTSKQNALSAQQLANIAAVSDALAFDATHSYAAGDPVVYNGTLYTFTATHTGAWTGSDVSAVDIIARLAGKLDKNGGTVYTLTVRNPITVGSAINERMYGVNSISQGSKHIDFPAATGTLALTANIPYTITTKTINNGAVSLDDRASNSVTVSATLSPNTLTINFPTAPTGKLRDFAMRLNIAAGVTAPEIAWPQGVTLENNGGEVPEIADGGTGGSSTILYFSETENNGTTAKFLVKGETLTAIAQA